MHTPTNFDQTDRSGTAPALRYNGAGPLAGIPYVFQDLGLHRNDIVAEFDNGMTTILQQSLSGKQAIHFMPTEVSDDTKYVNGLSTSIADMSLYHLADHCRSLIPDFKNCYKSSKFF